MDPVYLLAMRKVETVSKTYYSSRTPPEVSLRAHGDWISEKRESKLLIQSRSQTQDVSVFR